MEKNFPNFDVGLQFSSPLSPRGGGGGGSKRKKRVIYLKKNHSALPASMIVTSVDDLVEGAQAKTTTDMQQNTP